METFLGEFRRLVPGGMVQQTLLSQVLEEVDPSYWKRNFEVFRTDLPEPVPIEMLADWLYSTTMTAGAASEQARIAEAGKLQEEVLNPRQTFEHAMTESLSESNSPATSPPDALTAAAAAAAAVLEAEPLQLEVKQTILKSLDGDTLETALQADEAHGGSLVQKGDSASGGESAKACATPKKPEVENLSDHVVRRKEKFKSQPLTSWPEQGGSPQGGSLLLKRRHCSMPNMLLPLKIDSSSPTSPGSAASTVDTPSQASRSFFDFYDLLPDILGRGSLGTVRCGVRKADGKKVAVKIMSAIDDEMTIVAKREFELLRSISHPYVVQALDIFYAATCTELVLDYFQGKTMEDVVKFSPRQSLLEGDSRLLFVKLLYTLAHLHRMQIIHRDIKPQNILISEDLQNLRLLDFNSARRNIMETFENWALSPTGTCMYAAPEVVAGQPHGASSDVWSAGLCCHLMLVGKLPQRRGLHKTYQNFRKEVTTATVTLKSSKWQDISEPCKSALRRCLDLDNWRRPTADILLKEEYFGTAMEVVSQNLQGLT